MISYGNAVDFNVSSWAVKFFNLSENCQKKSKLHMFDKFAYLNRFINNND